ncbi:MAG TPA: hypothetical protein VIJ38_00850 [Acidobacteriaceae bacterium]
MLAIREAVEFSARRALHEGQYATRVQGTTAHKIANQEGRRRRRQNLALAFVQRSTLDLINDLAARVSSLTFCGNLVPVSTQSQDDLMKVVRDWKGTLWKNAAKVELERPKIFGASRKS